MSAANKDRINRLVLELLAENPDDAAVALFTRLCRQSPKLRAWLWDEFARSPKTRAEFARILEQKGVKADNLTLAHVAGEDQARDLENARLGGDWLTGSTLRPYGGLSRPEVEGWIRRYQSGSLHPATFQLVLVWRRTRGIEPADAALVRASAAFLAEALGRNNRGLLRQLVRIERFFRAREKLGRAAYGHLHRRTGEQRGCTSGNPRPPNTMRPISINRQFSTRPITSPKNGLSRWSRQRRTTLTAPDTINGPGALILIIPDFASVRISVAASAVLPVHFVLARVESRKATEHNRAGSRCVATPWWPAQADGGRSEGARSGLRARAISSRHSTRPRRPSAARRGFVTVGYVLPAAVRRSLVSACCLANAGRRRVMSAALTRSNPYPPGLRRTASP